MPQSTWNGREGRVTTLMCVPAPASWSSSLVLWFSLSKVSKHKSVVSCVLVDVFHLANGNCNRQRRLIYHHGKSNAILFDSQISQLSGFSSSGLWPKRSTAEPRQGSCRDRWWGHTRSQSLGLGLLGLGHLLACSPEIAFHLHKLWGIFLLFL